MNVQLRHTLGILLLMLVFGFTDTIAQGRGRGNDKPFKHKKEKHHHHGKWYHDEHHKGGPPSWAPAHGYRAKRHHIQTVRYVYNPDYNIYFDRHNEVYIYTSRGRWVVSARLPISLNHRSVRDGFLVEIELTGHAPYAYNHVHVKQYRRYAKRRYYAYCGH